MTDPQQAGDDNQDDVSSSYNKLRAVVWFISSQLDSYLILFIDYSDSFFVQFSKHARRLKMNTVFDQRKHDNKYVKLFLIS